MGFVLGTDAKLYRNTGSYNSPSWNEIPNVKDLTLNLEKNEADATTRGNNGWEAVIAALKKASIEFNMVYDTSDPDVVVMLDSFLNDGIIDFAIVDGDIDDGAQGLRADCQVFKFSRQENLQEALMIDVAIKPTYSTHAPTWLNAEENPTEG